MIGVRRLLALAGEVRWQVLATCGLGLAVNLSYVLQGVVLALVLSRIFAGQPLAAQVGPLLAAGAIGLARAALLWLGEVTAQQTAHAVKERLRSRLFARLLQLGPGYTVGQRAGEIQTTVVDGVEALEVFYGRLLPALALALIVPLGIVAYLATLDGVTAGIVAGCILFLLAVPHLWMALSMRDTAAQERWAAFGALVSEYVDALQGIVTLKAFGAGRRRRDLLAGRAEVLRAASMASLRFGLFYMALITFGIVAGTALILGVGAARVANGTLPPFVLFAALFLGREALRPFGELAEQFHPAENAFTAAGRIDALLRATPPLTEPARATAAATASGAGAGGRIEPSIRFERVTFGYGEAPAVLRDFSLSVGAGETVAIVGRSGSGKTTVASLLLRFFDPQAGRIVIGGRDLRDLPVDDLRAMVALVSQDTYLFHGTIAENIGLARPEATAAQIEAAARAANAHDFISGFPEGYRTPVGERGLQLSGGQRQRIAIARALLADRPILVLDEATSNVDAASEAAIQEALARLTAHRTTIVIAHRLSTVRNADRIAVLAGGAAMEVGTHAELLDRRGEYANLVAAQAAAEVA